MSYNIDESSSSSASSDADEGWGGVAEVMGDEEEQKVLFQALDSFQYVSPVSQPCQASNSSSALCILNVSEPYHVDAPDVLQYTVSEAYTTPLVLQELIVCE